MEDTLTDTVFVCSLRRERSRSGFQPYPRHHSRLCRRCRLRTLIRVALLCTLLGRHRNRRLDAYRWNLVRRRPDLSANMANHSPGSDFSRMCQRRDITFSPHSPSCGCTPLVRSTMTGSLNARTTRSFSLGAIVTSILGLIILPRFSCTAAASETGEACNVATQNVGWRYMLGALAIVVSTYSSRFPGFDRD